jgi:6-phosphofructokinase 1
VVDICLIPEVPFTEDKLMAYIDKLLLRKGHTVICVAEGAGQSTLKPEKHQTDASGNPILGDVGQYLKDRIKGCIKVRLGPLL